MKKNKKGGYMKQSDINKTVYLLQEIKKAGIDPIIKLREILENNQKTGEVISCISCKKQNMCFSKDAIQHAINETALLKPFNESPLGSELFSWNARGCTEFEIINDEIFTGKN